MPFAFAVFAQADLEEHEARDEHQPCTDQRQCEHLAGGAGEDDRSRGAREHQQARRAKGCNAQAACHFPREILPLRRGQNELRVDPRDNRPVDGYVDIHAHVLPGIDDGPDDLDGSLAMARAAADSGIATIVATPHLRSDFPDVRADELAERCEALGETLGRERIPLVLVPGAEVSLPWAFQASDEELALASYGQRGTDLLIETPTMSLAVIKEAVSVLRSRGYRVTLGHPERGLRLRGDYDRLCELVTEGVLLQINADSLLGASSRRGTGRFARRLLSDGLAHAIASDGHRGTAWRPVTQLAAAVEVAAELVGSERARWMAQTAPAAILEGAEIPKAPAAIQRPRRPGLFGLGRR